MNKINLPGFISTPPPPELDDDYDEDTDFDDPDQEEDEASGEPEEPLSVTRWPEKRAADTVEATQRKPFAYSGSLDSSRYATPTKNTKYALMRDMTWEQARIALRRLHFAADDWRRRRSPAALIALAEFALTATALEPFEGPKGEHAPKLRSELHKAIESTMRLRLTSALASAEDNAKVFAGAITDRYWGPHWQRNEKLWARVPTAAEKWPRIIEATPDQVLAALDCLRTTWASWNARRPFADNVVKSMKEPKRDNLPTAQGYVEALHIAEMLRFTSARLAALYDGILHAMPIYRRYPAVSELEAIEAWWPWGRRPVLATSAPKPPVSRRATLDLAIVTSTQPQKVVAEVIEKTGLSRMTAQKLTADLRAQMRREREAEARAMLFQGMTRDAVAKAVGLSPSRISAMFSGEHMPRRRPRRTAQEVRSPHG